MPPNASIFAARKEGYGGSNANALDDPRLNEIARKAAVELDETKRRALLVDAFKIVRDEDMFIPLHEQPVAWAMRDNLDMPQFPDEYVRPWFAQMK